MKYDDAPIHVGTISIDPAGYEVKVDGQRVELTLMQFNLLHALARRPGWIHNADQLSDHMPDRHPKPTPASIRNQVYQLRMRLADAACQIQTVRGLGYRLCESSAGRKSTTGSSAPVG